MKQILPNIFVIEVPKDAYDIECSYIEDLNLTELSFEDSKNYCYTEDAPLLKGKFTLLGTVTPTEIDFDCEPIVEKHNDVCRKNMESQGIFYKDYTVGDYIFSSAEVSFRSALTAAGITEYEKLAVIKQQ